MGGRTHYGKLPGLKDVYLEDSYVLDVSEDLPIFRLSLLLVLRESHPAYAPPEGRARYCYKLGVLEFRDVTALEWTRRTMLKFRDADGRVDYGSVDVFYREEGPAGTEYVLEGDFGLVTVVSSPPTVQIL